MILFDLFLFPFVPLSIQTTQWIYEYLRIDFRIDRYVKVSPSPHLIIPDGLYNSGLV